MNKIPTDIDFLQFLGMQEQQYLEKPITYADELSERELNGIAHYGEPLPWHKTHDVVRLRPGEVSLWAGINGHGKSLLVGQVMLWLDSKIVVASLEMKPVATLHRMVHQALGNSNPSTQFIKEFLTDLDNFWIYTETDTVQAERILGLCHYAAKELGANHIMIDSLMKCGISPEDYPKQKEFVDRLCNCAKAHDIHIHLVHHIRKSDREGREPDKFDIKGAGEITDLVDNVFIVHRNKDKEQNEGADKMVPDETLCVAKQRHGEWEGKIALWFHKPSGQFISGPDALSLRWRA